MNKQLSTWLLVAFSAVCSVSCEADSAKFNAAAHQQEILDWRQTRLANLKDPGGYLNQVGLYWLEPGEYSFGSASSNDLKFSDTAASEMGVFTVTPESVSMRVAAGAEVRVNGEVTLAAVLPADTTGERVMATHKSLAWSVVERVGKFAIRLRDFEHPFVATFGPLPYFDVDSALRVDATLQRYAEPIIVNNKTVIDGLEYRPESPGIVEFEIDGEMMSLEAFASGDELFFVFGDETNRDMTYGAGRFLYAAQPGEDGALTLDFNKSYSPPCAFNDFATCPIASRRNRLPVRVEAGEQYDMKFHYSAEH